jgi:hypothetical protein
MPSLSGRSFIAIALFVVLCAVLLSRAAEAPADLCSLLPPAQVSKILGRPYDAPVKSVAPRPYPNTAEGTDCHYSTKGGTELWFRAYVDPTPSAAKDLFAKLKLFYSPPTPVSNIGDEAYFDPQHAIHVRKGRVRFYLNLGNDPRVEKPLKDLASQVVGHV